MQIHDLITQRRQRERRENHELLNQYWGLRYLLGRLNPDAPNYLVTSRRLKAVHGTLVNRGVFSHGGH